MDIPELSSFDRRYTPQKHRDGASWHPGAQTCLSLLTHVQLDEALGEDMRNAGPLVQVGTVLSREGARWVALLNDGFAALGLAWRLSPRMGKEEY